MSKFSDDIKNHWNYYLELEDEFYHTKKYVDFSIGNYKTYSIEFLKLLQAVCGEIDTLGKVLAAKKNNKFDSHKTISINDWWFEIENSVSVTENLHDFNKTSVQKCFLFDFEITNYVLDETIKPWDKFHVEQFKDKTGENKVKLKGNYKTPFWWTDYNKTKHARTGLNDAGEINFRKANLKNLCFAIAALYSLEISLLEIDGTVDELDSFKNESKLFVRESFASHSDIDALFRG